MSKLFESQFSDGTGTVSIQYEGTKGASEAQVAADCNCGEDRTIAVSVESEDGSVKKTLTVNQEGVREQFIPAEETEGIICSDGLRFLTIKEKYADSMIECCKPVVSNTIYINQLESNPALMITGDVNGGVIQWIRQNSHRVLAKKTGEGTMTYAVLDDNNSTLYNDGTTADLTGAEGDVFVKLPTFYYAGNDIGDGSSGDNVEMKFSKEPFENSIEWDTNILIGVYESYNNGGKAYSQSDVQSTGRVSQANWKSYAQARGTGYQLVDWQMHCVLGCLYYAMYGNTDCQTTIGIGTNYYTKVNGQTNILGMTDTNASTNGNSQSINFWGLENWWGNKYEWMEEDNIGANMSTYDPVTKGSRNVAVPDYTGYHPKKMKFGKYLDLIARSDDPKNGGDSVGYCDYQYWDKISSSRVVRRSNSDSSTYGGVAYAYAGNGSSYTNSISGSRLAFRGICTEETDIAAFKALPVL